MLHSPSLDPASLLWHQWLREGSHPLSSLFHVIKNSIAPSFCFWSLSSKIQTDIFLMSWLMNCVHLKFLPSLTGSNFLFSPSHHLRPCSYPSTLSLSLAPYDVPIQVQLTLAPLPTRYLMHTGHLRTSQLSTTPFAQFTDTGSSF